MLVLERKTRQGISIGNDITIIVLQASRGKVRLGIRAPQEMRIARVAEMELIPDYRIEYGNGNRWTVLNQAGAIVFVGTKEQAEHWLDNHDPQ